MFAERESRQEPRVAPVVAGRRGQAPPKSKTILVVDDEDAIRKLLSNLLAMKGHGVVEAANGREALELYGSLRSEIALVITDVQMPVMNGLEAADRIRAMSPEVPVIVMTGAAGELEQKLDRWQPLRKPFRPADLLARVQSALG